MDPRPGPAFARVTKRVAELYGVSIALVSLVAEDREWFKSAHGPDASETPRDSGLSRHVVAAGRPVMVTDMSADPRFQGNPRATGDPHIRFYAGVPLRAYNGAILGTLCLKIGRAHV